MISTSGIPNTFLIDIYIFVCRNSILTKSPWKQKQRRITVREKFDGFNNGNHCLHDHLSMQTVRTRNFIMKMIMMMMIMMMMMIIVIIISSLKTGNKAYQAGKDLDALYLYSQVSQTCQASQYDSNG